MDNITPIPELHNESISCSAYFKESITARDSTGIYIGRVLICSYHYNGLRAKGADHKTYAVYSYFPGLKRELGYYATVEECRERCIKVAKHVLKMLSHNYETEINPTGNPR